MLIMVNVDHIAGETIPYVIDSLLARGAHNVHVTQAITKKGRPEYLFFADVPQEMLEPVGDFLVGELGTLGFRVLESRHVKFEYQVVQRHLVARDGTGGQELLRAPIRVKLIHNSRGEVASVKAEYEDVRASVEQLQQLGIELSLTTVREMVELAARGGQRQDLGNLSVEA